MINRWIKRRLVKLLEQYGYVHKDTIRDTWFPVRPGTEMDLRNIYVSNHSRETIYMGLENKLDEETDVRILEVK